MTGRERAGVALVICAPSGTGKTTLIRRLAAEFPRLSFSISCTTRAPRPGEVDGRDYCFLTRNEFTTLRDQGHFAEWAEVHGHLYGTPLGAARDLLDAGRDLLFDIDVQGAAQLRQTMPQARFVFLLPPSREALVSRLRGRGSETDASLSRRLENARRELAQASWFEFWIVNDNVEAAYRDLTAVYRATALVPGLRADYVTMLLKEWPHEESGSCP